MRNFKKIAKCIIFIAVCIIINGILNFILIPSGYTRVILHELNSKDKNFETIIVGQSHGRSDIDPHVLDDEQLGNAMNLCIPGESVRDAYFLVKESTRNNKVKRVILDLDYQYWNDYKENVFGSTFIYNQLTPSLVKLDYLKSYLLDKDFRISLTRWANSTDYWSDVKSNVKNKLTADYFNYSINAVKDGDAGGPYTGQGFYSRVKLDFRKAYSYPVTWDATKINTDAYDYFISIVKFCRKNNIELICTTSPITPFTIVNGNYNDVNLYFTKLCEENGVKYYDFNLVRKSVLELKNSDYDDFDGHMCGELADKYTKVMADVINAASDGTLDESKYFYPSFQERLNSIKKVVSIKIKLRASSPGNGMCGLTINARGAGGSDVNPEYKVVITDQDGNEVMETDYSSMADYYYQFEPGTYTVTVFARNQGIDVDYEEYNNKTIELK